MKLGNAILSSLLLLCAATAQAQLYKWVGPDGKITYSDVPPPPTAKQVETKSLGANGANTASLPYALAEAVKNNPVNLYTTPKCASCDDGRKLLIARGVPFTEKTVSSNEDIEQLRKISGASQLPFLLIGRNKQTGFETNTWNAALSSAGYPESNQLPKSYRNGKAETAAPVAKAPVKDNTENTAPEPARSDTTPIPAAGNAPPGFRF